MLQNLEDLRKKKEKISIISTKIQLKTEELDLKSQELMCSDQQVQQKTLLLCQKEDTICQQEQELCQKEQEIMQKINEIQQHLKQIKQQDQELQCKNQVIQLKEQEASQKDQEMQQKTEELHLISQVMKDKDQQIKQLEDDISSLQQNIDDLQKPTWIIEKHDIIVSDKVLGTGGWGTVKEAMFCGCKVAVKSLAQNIISHYNLGLFAREMNIASRCRHPNLLQFIGATNAIKEVPLIVTEIMHTSLRKVLQEDNLVSSQIVPILLGIAYGLNYLHKTTPSPILHRDVSSANVLLNSLPNNQWHPKLSDFGSTNFMRASNTVAAGNPAYAAPEALRPQGPYTPAMDVFSFGVLMYEMCSRKFPTNKPNALILRHVKWSYTETRLVGLIQSCLCEDIQKRSTMEYLIGELQI